MAATANFRAAIISNKKEIAVLQNLQKPFQHSQVYQKYAEENNAMDAEVGKRSPSAKHILTDCQIRELWAIPAPSVATSPPQPSVMSIFESEETRKKMANLEEKLQEMAQLQQKMQKIAITGDMDELDKKKYCWEAGTEKRLALSQRIWDEMFNDCLQCMAEEEPNSPYHVSKFVVDRFLTRAKEEVKGKYMGGSTTEEEREELDIYNA